jgi:hypothetical protein
MRAARPEDLARANLVSASGTVVDLRIPSTPEP